MERTVEEFARAIAGKHSSCAVGAMGAGSQADDQQLGARVAKAWDGLPPIIFVAIHPPLFSRNFTAVPHKSRAQLAGDDFLLKQFEGAVLVREVRHGKKASVQPPDSLPVETHMIKRRSSSRSCGYMWLNSNAIPKPGTTRLASAATRIVS
jgi:hypothetical protein